MKKLLTLLAIFCVIASAGAVCAEDVSPDGWAGSQYQDEGGYAGSQYQDDGGWAGSQYQDEGGYAGSQYQDDGGWAGSQYNETVENAAGEPGNLTTVSAGFENTAINDTANATSFHTMLATGNPILALFAVCAVLGGYTVIRRK